MNPNTDTMNPNTTYWFEFDPTTGQHFRQKKGNEYVDFGDHVTDSTHAPGRGIIPLNDTSAIIGTRVSRWSDVLRILTPCVFFDQSLDMPKTNN